ncbi:MAG: metallophosphoesterase family protein [Candidatus Cloacimonadales bacterium]|nr:metallophosphoesterase family protein [Candidatus Cloacimonadales bacterium]
MKKIMIVSDTHKNQALLRKAFENESGVSHIFHLGDDYGDMDENFDLLENRILVKVPGLYHDGYRDGSIPRIQTVEIAGWKFQLAHFVKDINAIPADIIVIFYGHTHRWNFKKLDDIYFVNPGHLKNFFDRGNEATYLILEVTPDKLDFRFKNIENKTYLRKIVLK